MSDDARRVAEELRQKGRDDIADLLDKGAGINTRSAPQAGSSEPPPGIPGDSNANRAANTARAQAETDAHFRGLSDEQIGEEMDARIFAALRGEA
jgi:hypothetical protein